MTSLNRWMQKRLLDAVLSLVSPEALAEWSDDVVRTALEDGKCQAGIQYGHAGAKCACSICRDIEQVGYEKQIEKEWIDRRIIN